MSKKLYDVAEFNRQSFFDAIDKAVSHDTLGGSRDRLLIGKVWRPDVPPPSEAR
jgi:hypothetical protein